MLRRAARCSLCVPAREQATRVCGAARRQYSRCQFPKPTRARRSGRPDQAGSASQPRIAGRRRGKQLPPARHNSGNGRCASRKRSGAAVPEGTCGRKRFPRRRDRATTCARQRPGSRSARRLWEKRRGIGWHRRRRGCCAGGGPGRWRSDRCGNRTRSGTTPTRPAASVRPPGRGHPSDECGRVRECSAGGLPLRVPPGPSTDKHSPDSRRSGSEHCRFSASSIQRRRN